MRYNVSCRLGILLMISYTNLLGGRLVWQIQEGYERDAVKRNFLKFVTQTIKEDLEKNHSKVLKDSCRSKR
jgi:hypothetical protein